MTNYKAFATCIEKRVNLNELIILVERGYRNPLKKYNFSKKPERKLTKDEFLNIKAYLCVNRIKK